MNSLRKANVGDLLIALMTAGCMTEVALAQVEAQHDTGFALRSSAVGNGGALPVEFTGDGAAATLPLEWSDGPAGTKSFAVIMHHIDPEGRTKWYWLLYNIPAAVHSLARNTNGIGTLGNNSVNGRVEYAPPHSKGAGPKTYVYTVYALDSAPQVSVAPEKVSREVLLAAMKDHILASVELKVVYTRQGAGTRPRDPDQQNGEERRPPPPPPPPDEKR
jgi:phosphatidylethanolamine-binding protein (PEBP) family uncharacterized protein